MIYAYVAHAIPFDQCPSSVFKSQSHLISDKAHIDDMTSFILPLHICAS